MEKNAKSTDSLLSLPDKEAFFNALENDNQLFLETLEVILTLVISDPKLTFDVADLIASDYRNLYLTILKKRSAREAHDNKMDCCK